MVLTRTVGMILELIIKMIGVLAIVVVAASSINGHPLEVAKPQDYSKYFLNSRIVGGVDAPKGYGKYMAALVFGYQWVSLVCGGSIITRRHILTAAHCIDMFVSWDGQLISSFRGIIGTHTWSTGSTGTTKPKNVRFINHVLHPGWDWATIKYDVGLLMVAADIHPSRTVAIIPINFDFIKGYSQALVTGWGMINNHFELPEHLQLLYVKTISHWECTKRMDWATENWGPGPGIQKDIEICTLHSPGHGMCNGDSGSALVLNKTQELIGVVSWGYPCALGVPDVFARISGFKEFILKYIKGYLPHPCV